jgi:hypothetical protein
MRQRAIRVEVHGSSRGLSRPRRASSGELGLGFASGRGVPRGLGAGARARGYVASKMLAIELLARNTPTNGVGSMCTQSVPGGLPLRR